MSDQESEYRAQVLKKVYDRELSVAGGAIVDGEHIHIGGLEDPAASVRVDDISDEIHVAGVLESGGLSVECGFDLSADEARELAGALYETAHVQETWYDE